MQHNRKENKKKKTKKAETEKRRIKSKPLTNIKHFKEDITIRDKISSPEINFLPILSKKDGKWPGFPHGQPKRPKN